MVLTLRKVKDKYCLVDKKTGKIKKSFDTKAEALTYEEPEKKIFEEPKKFIGKPKKINKEEK